MLRNEAKDKIIFPLDVSNIDEANSLVKTLRNYVGMFKIGLEFVWSSMASLLSLPADDAVILLKDLRQMAKLIGGQRAFIDSKLADIPNTVKGASVAISSLGVKFFNVHASSGVESVRAAVVAKGNSKVLGVTVLTSINEDECVSVFGDSPKNKVLKFAQMLLAEGADGIICSPKELVEISGSGRFDNLLKVTPGVRPAWAAVGDQKRVMTPGEAIRAGADYLVIGRPISKPPKEIHNSIAAVQLIIEEIMEEGTEL